MKYLRVIFRKIMAFLTTLFYKICYFKSLKIHFFNSISNTTSIVIESGKMIVGKKLSTRKNVEFRVNKNGKIIIGDNCFFNSNCIIASHNEIQIGKNCSFGPNVMIYDHDHDYEAKDGKNSKEYKTGKIIIGDNVWIGANTVILRNTVIGNNSVIGAGSVVKENIEDDVLVFNKRNTIIKKIIHRK